MRDFQRDAARAAAWTGEIPAGDFSWSLARHALFRACPRAFFLSSYMAQGGWDPYAAKAVRECYAEKQSQSVEEWIEQSLGSAIACAVERAAEAEGGYMAGTAARALIGAAARIIAEADVQLRNEEWRHDPKKLRLLEPQRFPDAARGLRSAAKALSESDLLLRLLNVEPPEWRRLKSFEQFKLDGVTVWIKAPLAWVSQGRASFLEANASDSFDKEEAALHAGILDLFASSRFKTPSGTSRLILALPSGAGIEIEPATRQARELAARSSKEMLAMLRPDGKAAIEDFPLKLGACRNLPCRFQRTCEKTTAGNKEAP